MFKSLVWATDGSEHADRALAYAKHLAQAEGASITIVHIVETGHGAGAVFLPRREEEEQIIKRLEQVVSELDADGLTVALEVRDDPGLRPAHEIAEIARAAKADLIVVATRGVSAIGGLVLGGVTQRLLHIAPCPVLVVPADGTQPAA